MVSSALRISLVSLLLVACSSSTPQGASTADQTATAAPSATPTAAVTAEPAAAPTASSAAPAASSAAAAPAPEDNHKLAADDIAAGRLSHHPYKYDLAKFVFPFHCNKNNAGWSGDGVIEIKDGKVVSFQAGDASSMQKYPAAKGKAVPAIPAELLPLFKKPVAFDVGC